MFNDTESRSPAPSPVGLQKMSTPFDEEESDRFDMRDREWRSDSYRRNDRNENRRADRYDDDERMYRPERGNRKHSSRPARRSKRVENDCDWLTDDRRKVGRRRRSKYKPGEEYFDDPNITNRYKYVRYLNHGSYGWVCEAECKLTKKRVAIKKVPNIFNNTVDAKRLLRELCILRSLGHHRSIVNMLDVIPPPDIMKFDALSIVCEFVETDLRQLIASDQYFTTQHIEHMLHQLLLGLKYMHSANIAHRDIKPANILVNGDCSLKICDFGLARGLAHNVNYPVPNSRSLLPFVEEDEKEIMKPKPKTPEELELEVTSHVVTRWYRAPEVILLQQEREYLLALDMWAVGCIIAELLQMMKENCPVPADRTPLFPGASSFPLSAEDQFAWKDSRDQLNVIFDVIGTPSRGEIQSMTNNRAKKYLQSLTKRYPIDWRKRFPGANAKVLELMRGLLRFSYKKRLTVDQCLDHKFFRKIRDKESEVKHKKIQFDFEDVPIKIQTIKELIIDEILFWNINMAEQLKRYHGRIRHSRRDKLQR